MGQDVRRKGSGMNAPQIIGSDKASPAGGQHVVQVRRGDDIVATLYLGDAYAIRPTLGWMSCDMMDPPYLIETSGGGMFRSSSTTMDEIADMGIDQGFDHSIINPLLCGAVIVFCHNDQLPDLLPDLRGLFSTFAVCDWYKPNPMPVANKHYVPDREFYVHAWTRDFAPVGTLKEKRRTIIAPSDQNLRKRFGHPTIKPEMVMDKIMANIAGQTICDPFMGTGSTGVAAVKAGKTFFGIERDPRWFEAAVIRIREAAEGLA